MKMAAEGNHHPQVDGEDMGRCRAVLLGCFTMKRKSEMAGKDGGYRKRHKGWEKKHIYTLWLFNIPMVNPL
jgi:hypothetical protein